MLSFCNSILWLHIYNIFKAFLYCHTCTTYICLSRDCDWAYAGTHGRLIPYHALVSTSHVHVMWWSKFRISQQCIVICSLSTTMATNTTISLSIIMSEDPFEPFEMLKEILLPKFMMGFLFLAIWTFSFMGCNITCSTVELPTNVLLCLLLSSVLQAEPNAKYMCCATLCIKKKPQINNRAVYFCTS